MNFNTNTWMKNQYLTEAGLQESTSDQAARAIDKAVDSVDNSMSPGDFAKAVALVLKGNDEDIIGFGSQNFKVFMDVLHAELGMKESLSEAKKSLGEEFSEEFKVRASSDEDSITIRTKDIIGDDTAERMIDWVESKGYIVDRKRSSFDYDYEPGERDFWPRIRFNKK